MPRLVLASQSAVRGQLLRAAGLQFETASPGVDEDALKQRLSGAGPKAIAVALADAKAVALKRDTEDLVIGADQTLEFEGRLFDKARDLAEARTRLLTMRGKPHELHAAVAVARGGSVLWREVVTTRLVFRNFSDAWLEGYLARNGEAALSSVGCYQLEGEGVQLFSALEGDYFAILGLPMLGLLDHLRGQGVITA